MPDRISKQKELVGKLQAEYNEKYASSTSKPPLDLKLEVERLVEDSQPGMLAALVQTMSERRDNIHHESDDESDWDDEWDPDHHEAPKAKFVPAPKKPQITQAQQDAQSAVNFVARLADCFEETKPKFVELQKALANANGDTQFLAVEQKADALFELAIKQIKVSKAKPSHRRQVSNTLSGKLDFLERSFQDGSFKSSKGRAMTEIEEPPPTQPPVRPATTQLENIAPATEEAPKQLGLAELFKKRAETLTAPPVHVAELLRTTSEKQRFMNEIEKQAEVAAEEQLEKERQDREQQERAEQELKRLEQEQAEQERKRLEQEQAEQEQKRLEQELAAQEPIVVDTRRRSSSLKRSSTTDERRLSHTRQRSVSFGKEDSPIVEVTIIPAVVQRKDQISLLSGIMHKSENIDGHIQLLNIDLTQEESLAAKQDAINAIASISKRFNSLMRLLDISDLSKDDSVDLQAMFERAFETNKNKENISEEALNEELANFAKHVNELKMYLLHAAQSDNILKYPEYTDDLTNTEKKERYEKRKQNYNDLLAQLPEVINQIITLVDTAQEVCVKFGVVVADANIEKEAIAETPVAAKVEAAKEHVIASSEKPKLTIPELIDNAKHATEVAPLLKIDIQTSTLQEISAAFESAKEESVHLLELISAVELAAPQDKVELKTALSNLRILIKALDEDGAGPATDESEKFAQINEVKYDPDKQGLNDQFSEAFQVAAEAVEALYYMLYKRPEPLVEEELTDEIASQAEAAIPETKSQIVGGRVKSELEIETIPLQDFYSTLPKNPAELDLQKAKEAIAQANDVLGLVVKELTNKPQLLDSADKPILDACLKYRKFLIAFEATDLGKKHRELVAENKAVIDQIKSYVRHNFTGTDNDVTVALRNILYVYVISISATVIPATKRRERAEVVQFNDEVQEHGESSRVDIETSARSKTIEIDPSLQEAVSSVQEGREIFADVEARKRIIANADKLKIAKDTNAIFQLGAKISTKVQIKHIDWAVENLNLIIFYALAAYEVIKDIGSLSLADRKKMSDILKKSNGGDHQISYEELMFLRTILVDPKTRLVIKIAGRQDLEKTYNETIDKIGAMIKQAIILDAKIKLAQQLPVVTKFNELKKKYIDAIGETEPTQGAVDLVKTTRSNINVLLQQIDILCKELDIVTPTVDLRKLLMIGTVDTVQLRKGIKQQTYKIKQMQELPSEVMSALIGAMQTFADIKELEVLIAIGHTNIKVRGLEDQLLDRKHDDSNDYTITDDNHKQLSTLAKNSKQQNDAVLVGLRSDSNITLVVDRARFDKYYDLVAGTTELNVSKLGMPAVAAAFADAIKKINADKKVPPVLRKLFVSILETSLEVKVLDTQLAPFVKAQQQAEQHVEQTEQVKEEAKAKFVRLTAEAKELVAKIASYKDPTSKDNDPDANEYAAYISKGNYIELSEIADSVRENNLEIWSNFGTARQLIGKGFDIISGGVTTTINAKPSRILSKEDLETLNGVDPDTILQVQLIKVEEKYVAFIDGLKSNALIPQEMKDFIIAVLETELEVKRLKNAIKVACIQNKWITPAKSKRNLFAQSASQDEDDEEEKSEELQHHQQDENAAPQTNIPRATELPKRRSTVVEPPSAASRTSTSFKKSNAGSSSGANLFGEDDVELAMDGSFDVPPQANIGFDELRNYMANQHTRDNYLVEDVRGKREFNVSIKETVRSSPAPKVTKILTVSEGTGIGASGNPEVAKFTIPQDDAAKIQEGLKVMFADLKSFKAAKENAGGEKLEYCVPINFNPTGTATNEQIVERARCFFTAYWEVFKNAAGTGLDYNLTIQPDEDTRLSLIAVLKAGIPGLDESINTQLRHHFQDSTVAAAKLGRKPPLTATSNRNATLLLEEQKGWSLRHPLTRTPTNKFDRPARS